jgi:CelD/BcsL family acetyltransferase involved in cellulose biosynthesis
VSEGTSLGRAVVSERTVPAPSPATALSARWREEDSALRGLAGEWNDLLRRSAADNVFLTHEWVSTWWKHFGEKGRLRLLEMRDEEGNLRGLAPLKQVTGRGRFGKVRRLEFIGFGGEANPDHLDFIFERGRERECFDLLWGELLARRGDWDLLHLASVDSASPTAVLLRERASRRRVRLHSFRATVCPYVELPGDYEALLAGLRPKLRRDIRKSWNRLQKLHHVEIVACEEPESTDHGFEELARLHQLRMQDTDRGGNFANERYGRFHREVMRALAGRGWLELKLLEIEGRSVAANYSLRYGKVLYGYQMGLDPEFYRYSLGTVLLARMAKDLIENGFREIDFLRGASPWKYRWTKTERIDESHILVRPGWRGRFAYWSDLLGQKPVMVLKRVLTPSQFERLRFRLRGIRRGPGAS